LAFFIVEMFQFFGMRVTLGNTLAMSRADQPLTGPTRGSKAFKMSIGFKGL
jgi:hypothetical protein